MEGIDQKIQDYKIYLERQSLEVKKIFDQELDYLRKSLNAERAESSKFFINEAKERFLKQVKEAKDRFLESIEYSKGMKVEVLRQQRVNFAKKLLKGDLEDCKKLFKIAVDDFKK